MFVAKSLALRRNLQGDEDNGVAAVQTKQWQGHHHLLVVDELISSAGECMDQYRC